LGSNAELGNTTATPRPYGAPAASRTYEVIDVKAQVRGVSDFRCNWPSV
jgi:hypothetical protein